MCVCAHVHVCAYVYVCMSVDVCLYLGDSAVGHCVGVLLWVQLGVGVGCCELLSIRDARGSSKNLQYFKPFYDYFYLISNYFC